MKESYFSGEQTETLLKTIVESNILGKLTTFDLFDSTDFSSDISVIYLAQILAKAQNLQFIDIAKFEAVREI